MQILIIIQAKEINAEKSGDSTEFIMWCVNKLLECIRVYINQHSHADWQTYYEAWLEETTIDIDMGVNRPDFMRIMDPSGEPLNTNYSYRMREVIESTVNRYGDNIISVLRNNVKHGKEYVTKLSCVDLTQFTMSLKLNTRNK